MCIAAEGEEEEGGEVEEEEEGAEADQEQGNKKSIYMHISFLKLIMTKCVHVFFRSSARSSYSKRNPGYGTHRSTRIEAPRTSLLTRTHGGRYYSGRRSSSYNGFGMGLGNKKNQKEIK